MIAWDPNNQIQIEISLNWHQEFTKMVEYCKQMNPVSLKIVNLNTSINNSFFIVDLKKTVWGMFTIFHVYFHGFLNISMYNSLYL